MKVFMLDEVRFHLLCMPVDTQFEVACGLNRMEAGSVPPAIERVGGTRRLYRWQCGDCRILYVEEKDRIVVLSLSLQPRDVPRRYRPQAANPVD